MNEIILSVILFALGIFTLLKSVERFVEGLVGSAMFLGVSVLALGIIFAGFDPENTVTGVFAATENLHGVALGTTIGSTIFLMGVALGLCGVIFPIRIKTPKKYILLTLLSPIPMILFMIDGVVSRIEGLILVSFYIPFIWYVYRASRVKEIRIESEEVEEVGEEIKEKPKRFYILLLIGGLLGITIGGWLTVTGTKGIVEWLKISETVFGMTVVAIAVCLEEILLELVPAHKGRPDVSVGNVIGTVIYFVTANVGIIALIRPLNVDLTVLTFHLPFMIGVLALTSLFFIRKRVGRVEGMVLLACYGIYLLINLSLIK